MRRWCQVLAVSTLALAPVGMVACDDGDSQPSPNGNKPAKSAPPNDLQLVEHVLQARKEYQASLETLREYYGRQGDNERKAWVEEELLSFHRISKRAYRLDLDVPPPTLKGTHNVNEANELFRRAMAYKENRAWGLTNQSGDNLRRAEILFQQLLTNYPQSDKIDDAAYQLGEIYENTVFKQHRRAAAYYERCFQWNPDTDTDARLRAARLYDKSLQDRAHAIQLYREVLKHDGNQKRVDEAKKRLAELSAAPSQ